MRVGVLRRKSIPLIAKCHSRIMTLTRTELFESRNSRWRLNVQEVVERRSVGGRPREWTTLERTP